MTQISMRGGQIVIWERRKHVMQRMIPNREGAEEPHAPIRLGVVAGIENVIVKGEFATVAGEAVIAQQTHLIQRKHADP